MKKFLKAAAALVVIPFCVAVIIPCHLAEMVLNRVVR